ncbi:hypothetical protein NDU88_002910 [Pleurodeles waltl]|uniref:Uncharacterized protein n=1 Tax=Pleurodeles waltl TaxID=8319 RepID=A0AAV7MR03_PLEWA|nr:hypothetical protein NDU88_002910 [Pleurodeles waltl]
MEAQQHYARVWADNVTIQQSLAKVFSKVSALAIEKGELQQRVACEEEVGMAVVKSVENHDCCLNLIQIKPEDLENLQRRYHLQVFGIPEGIEGTDPDNSLCSCLARRSLTVWTETWTHKFIGLTDFH